VDRQAVYDGANRHSICSWVSCNSLLDGHCNLNPVADLDGDGKIDQADVDLLAASDAHDKQETQRYMAICAFVLMVVITIVMCTPIIPDERVKSLSGLISSMYFALASLCGAYMGFTTWANKK